MTLALIFELEGVIVETLAPRAQALREAMAADGIAIDHGEATEASRGRSVRRAVARVAYDARVAFDLVAVDLAASRAEQAFMARATASGLVLTPGAAEFVRHAQASARCAIATRASQAEMDVVLRLAGLADAFECVVTLEDVVEEKPAPAAHRAVLARLERRRAVPRRAVLALEDGGDGARAARAAGIACLVVGPAPASEALESDGYLPGLAGATMETVRAVGARIGVQVT